MFRNDYNPCNPKDDSALLRDFTPSVDIPTSDTATWAMYHQFRWMHNKMTLCDVQGIATFPDCIRPTTFPVFCKPILNIGGMSVGAQVIHTEEQWASTFAPGHFMMPILSDPEYSIDVALVRGIPKWRATMLEHKDSNGSFTMFERIVIPDSAWKVAETWIQQHFNNFTGIVNLEIMDGVVVESHQRLADQFIDLNGEGWIEAVVQLYEKQVWKFKGSPEHAYSIPIRVPKQNQYQRYQIATAALREAEQLVSVQLFTDIDHFTPYNDMFTQRVAVVNSFDLETANFAIQLLLDNLSIVP